MAHIRHIYCGTYIRHGILGRYSWIRSTLDSSSLLKIGVGHTFSKSTDSFDWGFSSIVCRTIKYTNLTPPSLSDLTACLPRSSTCRPATGVALIQEFKPPQIMALRIHSTQYEMSLFCKQLSLHHCSRDFHGQSNYQNPAGRAYNHHITKVTHRGICSHCTEAYVHIAQRHSGICAVYSVHCTPGIQRCGQQCNNGSMSMSGAMSYEQPDNLKVDWEA